MSDLQRKEKREAMSKDHYEIAVLIGPCTEEEAHEANDKVAEVAFELGVGAAVAISRDPEFLRQQEIEDGIRIAADPRAAFSMFCPTGSQPAPPEETG